MAFRQSGSFTRYYAPARGIDPTNPEFLKLVRKHRFRSIENEPAEVESVGWVTPADPTGTRIAAEDVVRGQHLFLCLRADRKSAPSTWVRLKVLAAEREERAAGRRVTRALRQELKEKVARELLERTLPAVGLWDVVWSLDRGQVFLFATSRRAQELFAALFARTFGGEPPTPIVAETLIDRADMPGAARAAWAELQPADFARSGA